MLTKLAVMRINSVQLFVTIRDNTNFYILGFDFLIAIS